MNLRRTDRKGAEKTNYESHIARVRQAKTLVDCQAPQPHPIANKVDIEKRKKHALIEHGNKLLLGRIASIVQTKTIDNDNCETTENQRILRRIQEVPPAYTHTEWDEHARATDKHRKSISIFPDHPDRNGKDTLSGKESMSGTGTARTSTMEFSTIASNAPKSPPARGAPPAFGFSVYGPLRTISPGGRERERERVRSLSSDGILPHLHNRK